MSITSGERHDLHTKLAEVLGDNRANTLMDHLPPVGWADVATKADVDNQGILLRFEVATLSAELRTEMTELGSQLRTEMTELGSELRTEMTELRTEFRADMTGLRTDMAELGHKLDVEGIARKGDMDALMSRVLREQRVFLTAIFLAISTLVALVTVFG